MIDVIDKLAKSSGAPTVEREDQSGKACDSWFVQFLFQCRALFKTSFREQVAESSLDLFELLRGDGGF